MGGAVGVVREKENHDSNWKAQWLAECDMTVSFTMCVQLMAYKLILGPKLWLSLE